jgi:hypothetical protein
MPSTGWKSELHFFREERVSFIILYYHDQKNILYYQAQLMGLMLQPIVHRLGSTSIVFMCSAGQCPQVSQLWPFYYSLLSLGFTKLQVKGKRRSQLPKVKGKQNSIELTDLGLTASQRVLDASDRTNVNFTSSRSTARKRRSIIVESLGRPHLTSKKRSLRRRICNPPRPI